MVLPVMHHRFARMNGHAHPQRITLCPTFGKQSTLGIEGSGNRIWSGGKSRLHGVADGLEQHAIMSLDGRTEKDEVAIDGSRHGRGISLPERGAARDVGEEEGDGAAGKIRHGSSRTIEKTGRAQAPSGPLSSMVVGMGRAAIAPLGSQEPVRYDL